MYFATVSALMEKTSDAMKALELYEQEASFEGLFEADYLKLKGLLTLISAEKEDDLREAISHLDEAYAKSEEQEESMAKALCLVAISKTMIEIKLQVGRAIKYMAEAKAQLEKLNHTKGLSYIRAFFLALNEADF